MVKEKLIEVCGIRNRLIKKRISNYITGVQFLMLNGEDVDIGCIVKRFITKQHDDIQLMLNALRNYEYFTSLMFAVTKENLELVKKEIENCDIDKQDNMGYTALMYACRFNENSDIVKFLLDKGASIYTIASNGRKALDFANDNGNSEIVVMLSEKTNERENHRDFDVVANIANEYNKKVRFHEGIIKMS